MWCLHNEQQVLENISGNLSPDSIFCILSYCNLSIELSEPNLIGDIEKISYIAN